MVTSYALVAPLSKGEEARRFVAAQGIGRSDLKLGKREAQLLIPITGPLDATPPAMTVEVLEFEASRPPGSYKQIVNVPSDLRSLLPSSFDIIGDLVLIKVPAALDAYAQEIARAILAAHPNIRGVFLDEGVEGPLRVRSLRHLAGETRTRTVHSEYGARFHVDLATAYFSPRLANEHERIASLAAPGETFVDATAGVGPFSVLAARKKRASRILAFDLNPAAIDLLRENLALNRVEERVEAQCADGVDALARVGTFQRAVVNLPHSGEAILEAAWRRVSAGGTLHYLVVWPEEEQARRERELVERFTKTTGRPASVTARRTVHPYSPKDRLYSLDILVT